jgi:hypothetical protein
MKPRIELSKSKNFVIWESGSYNPKIREGNGLLVGGPLGEKRQVIFDVNNPKKTNDHYLFFAEVGMTVANCRFQSTLDSEEIKVAFSLLRIKSLSLISTSAVNTEFEKIWAAEFSCSLFEVKDKLHDLYADCSEWDNTNYLDMLQEAYGKASCSKQFQRLFWGLPRPLKYHIEQVETVSS